MVSITRLPTVWPIRPLSQPGMTCSGDAPMVNPNGAPLVHEESKVFPVRQMTPTYWTTSVWPLVTLAPVPLMRVVVVRVFGVADDGILMVGAVPAATAATVGSPCPPVET